MKKIIWALILLMTFVSCGYASTRHPRSCGDIAGSTFITTLIITVFQWVRTKEDKSAEEEDGDETPPSSSGQDQHQHGHDNFSNTKQTANPKQDIAMRLVCIGLASIGRKSQYPNPYLTPEREGERHRVEYPFLKSVAERYKDAKTRKIMAKHFMLFKETCLYIVFSLLLKNDAELHVLVKKELSIWLTKGLSTDGAIRRKDYMYAFSKAFYDEYKRNRNLTLALNYMFWSVATDKYPDFIKPDEFSTLLLDGNLLHIYNYILKTLETEIAS